jgi:hypothetical protein
MAAGQFTFWQLCKLGRIYRVTEDIWTVKLVGQAYQLVHLLSIVLSIIIILSSLNQVSLPRPNS